MSNGTQTLTKRPDLVPVGAFTYPVKDPQQTRWFGFLLLPQFTLLAFSAALDPLRIANQLAQKPLYGWLVYSPDGAPVSSSSGIDIGVHASLEDLKPDTYLFACSGNNGSSVASNDVLAHIRRHVRFGGDVGGICTGAATLARAGLLAGKNLRSIGKTSPVLARSSQSFHQHPNGSRKTASFSPAVAALRPLK
jgi:putative intracellular protease/amidase